MRTRDRFEAEIRRALVEYDEGTQEAVIAHLRTKGILNERRAAESYVARRKGRGAELVREELRQKGAPEEVIDAVVVSDEAAGALAALRAKFHNRERTERARAGRFLTSRGFGEEVVEAALNEFGFQDPNG